VKTARFPCDASVLDGGPLHQLKSAVSFFNVFSASWRIFKKIPFPEDD